eukprot:scaffold8951_cov107-Skeletonema_dohrnii-CCMP3373.AAC.2
MRLAGPTIPLDGSPSEWNHVQEQLRAGRRSFGSFGFASLGPRHENLLTSSILVSKTGGSKEVSRREH